MSTITPSTVIWFCEDVPLDNRYQNTLLFTNRSAQQSYFVGKTAAKMTGCMYQRQNGTVRATVEMETLENCNYMMWQNVGTDSRTYFAFINGIYYVNNNVTEVVFQLDVLQTYMPDCTFRQCFIERGHTSDDTIGKNLVPENLETGEYKVIEARETVALNPMVICVAASVDENGEPVAGGYYSGVYSGIKIHVFDTAASCDAFLAKLTELGKSDAIVNVFMMPHTFQVAAGTIPKENEFNVNKPYSTVDGYTPRNNKLFTYPYSVLHVSNGEGISADYRFEFFSTNPCNIRVWGSMCTTPQAILVPVNYKGLLLNYGEKLVLDGWAQCAYTIDSYKAWLAQNANVIQWQDNTALMQQQNQGTRATNRNINAFFNVLESAAKFGMAGAALGTAVPGVGNVVGGAGGAAIGAAFGLGGALRSGIQGVQENQMQAGVIQNNIEGILAAREDHAITPPQAVSGGGSTVMQGLGLKGFWMEIKQITAEFARIIDDYFTMYGYAQHILARPNLRARTRYTFIKTQGCNAQGNAPVWAIKAINDIFDKGITVWYDTNVGDYTFPNPPIAGGDY